MENWSLDGVFLQSKFVFNKKADHFLSNWVNVSFSRGCSVAQTVNRRLPTAMATAPSQVRSNGSIGKQSSHRIILFPLPILITPITSDARRTFGFVIGFVLHFNTQSVTTLNYSAITDLDTLQFTRAHSLVFSVCYWTLPGKGFQQELFFCLRAQMNTELPGWCSHYITVCMDRVENAVSNSFGIVACVTVAAGTCLPSPSLAAAVCSCLLKSVA
jgi:hypothetical protein